MSLYFKNTSLNFRDDYSIYKIGDYSLFYLIWKIKGGLVSYNQMKNNFLKKLRGKGKIIVVLSFFIFLAVAGMAVWMSVAKSETIPQGLKLKAPKEKILKHEIIRDIRCDKNGKCQDYDEIVKYIYVSEKEAKEQMLGEVLSDSALQNNHVDLSKKNLKETSRDYNVQNFKLDDSKTLSIFYVGEPFVKEKATGKWFYSGVATTTTDAFKQQKQLTLLDRVRSLFQGSALADAGVYYPDPGDPGLTTMDGGWESSAGQQSWSTTCGLTTAPLWGNTATYLRPIGVRARTTGFEYLNRSKFGFDTSNIGSGIIDSATFSLYIIGSTQNADIANSLQFGVYSASPASHTTLLTTDFDGMGTNLWSSTTPTVASISAGAYIDFSLNSTGLAGIQKHGITEIGTRSVRDAILTAPTGMADYLIDCYINASSADEFGITQDPKLTVVYTSGPPPPLKGYKDIDESHATTILTDDLNLEADLKAGKIYKIEGLLFAIASSSVPDLKIGFTAPAGATTDIAYLAYSSGDNGILEFSGAASREIALKKNAKEAIEISGTVRTSDVAGALHLQWAQEKFSMEPVTLQAGSFLRVVELSTN